MIVYYSTIILVILFLNIRDERNNRTKFSFGYISATAILTIIAGIRYQVGTDYPHYVRNYLYLYTQTRRGIFEQPAVTLIAKIAQFIYDDYATWFFLMSCLTIIPIMSFIDKRNNARNLCVLFYILLGCWHFSFNLVKQTAAATILFCGYNYIRDKKIKNWLIICLVAATFHISAIIMFPIYFVVNANIKKKNIVIILVIGLIVFFSYDHLFNLIDYLKQGQSTVHGYTKTESVNLLRILVGWIPIAICLFYKQHIFYRDDKDFSCLFYLSLFNSVINTAAINSIYLYRFCTYTNIYNILFIPIVLNNIKGKDKQMIKLVTLLVYFAFWSYDLYKGSTTVHYHFIFER